MPKAWHVRSYDTWDTRNMVHPVWVWLVTHIATLLKVRDPLLSLDDCDVGQW